MSNFDSREEMLKKDFGITWENKPATPEDNFAGIVSEEATIQYNIAEHEDQMQRIEQEKALYARFDGMNADQIAAEWRVAEAAENAKTLPARQAEAARQFVVEAPEFVLSPRNQERMDAYFQTAKLDASNPDHFHQAYKALASRNLIQVDESKRPRTPRQRLTTADLYEMPMEQLADLANAARRK